MNRPWIPIFAFLATPILFAQNGPASAAATIEPDVEGCAESRILPKFPKCRIDNCEKKEFDRKEVPFKEDAKGEALTLAVEGAVNTIMYECAPTIAPSLLIQFAGSALRGSGFEILYTFSEKEGSITARKGDQWVTVEAVARYYTLTEITVLPPDPDMVLEGDVLADHLEKAGHVPVYGVRFVPGRADILPESVASLKEVLKLLEEYPDLKLRVEYHTSGSGEAAAIALSQKRAAAVVAWLAGNGAKRSRLEARGAGDTHPIAGPSSESGRIRNQRIELVKINQ